MFFQWGFFKDADMPLDELLKMYSKNPPIINDNSLQDEEVKLDFQNFYVLLF